jgi:hypothetical protein
MIVEEGKSRTNPHRKLALEDNLESFEEEAVVEGNREGFIPCCK